MRFMKPEIRSPGRSTLLSRDIPAILPERLTEAIDDFRALPRIFGRIIAPEANETKISGMLLGGSSGLEGIFMLLASTVA